MRLIRDYSGYVMTPFGASGDLEVSIGEPVQVPNPPAPSLGFPWGWALLAYGVGVAWWMGSKR